MAQTFNCPNCGAPLDYQGSDPIIRCPYCNSSVIVPENLRARPQFSSRPDNFTLSGAGNLSGLVSQARRINEVKNLAQAGEMDKAVALYREITGAEEFAARQAVGNLSMGQPVVLSGVSSVSVTSTPSIQIQPDKTVQNVRRGVGCFFVGMTLFVLASVLIPIIAMFGFGAVFSGFGFAVPGLGFATRELSFGGRGSGPGLFEDARAIGVHPSNGSIYAANYADGRVQAFDPQGKFVTQWIIPKDKTDPYFDDMAVGRDGTIYIPVYGKLRMFDGSGKPLGELDLGRDYINNLDITADGTLVAIANGEDILWISPQGEILQRVDDAVSTVSGDSELSALVAVDGLGNLFVLGRFNDAVFVFDSKGKFVSRFGSGGDEPGQFRAPLAIEVDNKGRVFVSDVKGIQVFSNDGRYLDVIKVSSAVAYGLAFDDQNKLYITTGNQKVEKFSVKE